MKIDSPAWLNDSHPNYLRWKRSRDLATERGKFVHSIVNQKIKTENLYVLDLGSGEGGTSNVFSKNNFVISFDLSLVRLNRQKEYGISDESSKDKSLPIHENRFLSSFEITNNTIPHNIERVHGNALLLPFANNSFDLIIIQDVIEHLTNIKDFYSEIKRVLKSEGTIYLSTPNKYSIFNFLSDPHFGLPIVSVLSRKAIKRYFLKFLRKEDYNRNDIAQLLSLTELINLFSQEFDISLNTKFTVSQLLEGDKGIVWSDFHLGLIRLCNRLKLRMPLIKIANNKFGMLNKFFTPTYYMVLQKL